jgi:hypothetical protein
VKTAGVFYLCQDSTSMRAWSFYLFDFMSIAGELNPDFKEGAMAVIYKSKIVDEVRFRKYIKKMK